MDARRHKILNQMGIDVWYARPARGAGVTDAPDVAAPPIPEPEPAPAAAPAAAPVPPQSVPSVPETESLPTLERFELLCVRAADALLLSTPLASPKEQRLAHDIAVAVTLALGEAPQKADRLAFAFPQIETAASQDWSRALQAFTEKQREVVQPKLVMITRGAMPRFESWIDFEPLVIDDIAHLAINPDAKQVLWQHILKSLA